MSKIKIITGAIKKFWNAFTETEKLKVNDIYKDSPSFLQNLISGNYNYKLREALDENDNENILYSFDKNLAFTAKKNPCVCCGEYAKFKYEWDWKSHSKKNCPYDKFLKLDNHRNIQYLFELSVKYYLRSRLNFIKEKRDLKVQVKEFDAKMEKCKKLNDEVNLKLKIEIDKEKQNTKLFYRLMPIDKINENLERHRMEMEEMTQRKNAVEKEKFKLKKLYENLANEKEVWELNKEMKKLKLDNMEKKLKLSQEEKEIIEEEWENKYSNLEDSYCKTNNENVKLKKIYKNLKNEWKDTEKLNEKMMDLLKKQKKMEDDDCSICCEPILENKCKLECGHIFHTKCFCRFLLKKSKEYHYKNCFNCPNCRQEFIDLKKDD